MEERKFRKGEIYHICNKSIANFGIFKNQNYAERFLQILFHYNNKYVQRKFSRRIKDEDSLFNPSQLIYPKENPIVKFICYCMMPDHYHLLVKLLEDDVLSQYISNVENSYTRYFNLKINRKGPLWQSRFRAVRVRSNETLLHVSRYIHLNPTTAELVTNPENWNLSSYREYVNDHRILKEITKEISIRDMNTYRKFVEDRKDYQIKLKQIKRLLLD